MSQYDSPDELEGAFQKQRRIVIVVALALFVYYLALGRPEAVMHLPFVGLTLGAPWRIVWLLWVVLAYSTWRYWLYGRHLWPSTKSRLVSLHDCDPKVRALLDDYYQRDNPEHYRRTLGLVGGVAVHVNASSLRREAWNPFKIRYKCRLMVEGGVDGLFRQEPPEAMKTEIDLALPTPTVAYYWTRCFARAFLTTKELSDHIVPYILVVLTVVAALTF